MPTITYDKRDLLNLIGQDLSDEQLEEVVHLMKTNVEEKNEKEITIELTPDRPDLFGVEGLARAIRQYLGLEKGLKHFKVESAKTPIRVSEIPYRPFIGAAIVKDVVMADAFIRSLMNIQDVLTDGIGRKRKKVAIGIHDFDKIVPTIFYKEVDKSERIVPLEEQNEISLSGILKENPKGKTYAHILEGLDKFPIYADAKGIFSFPPIINSDRTRVTESTKNLLVELSGTDKESVLQTLNIIVTNFAERGATIEAVKIFYGEQPEIAPNLNPSTIDVEMGEIDKWLGINLKKTEVIELLERMGYDAVDNKGKITVYIPAYRSDILHTNDIIEDVAIAHGFNNFTPQLPHLATTGQSHPIEKFSGRVRQLMVGFGFQEVINPILSNSVDQFDKMNWERDKLIEIENPVSQEYNCLRICLKPGLLKFLSKNTHVSYPQNVFEVGDVVWIDETQETMSKSIRSLVGIVAGSKTNFTEAKNLVDSLMKNLGIDYRLEAVDLDEMISGRSAKIIVNEREVGNFGELNPTVLTNWKIEMPCTVLELDLSHFLS